MQPRTNAPRPFMPRDDRPALKNDTVAIVGTFRASPTATVRFVNYHLNAGVAHLFLFFDDPDDPAIGLVAHRERVTCVACDARYWSESGFDVPSSDLNRKQVVNADVGLRLARGMGIAWITHIDSDELLYAEDGIATALARVAPDVDAVTFRVLEAVPERLEYACAFEQVTTFKRARGRWDRARLGLARRLGCERAFYEGEYFRGHQCKTAVRTSADVESMGIHEPVGGRRGLKTVKSEDVKLLHYDACGFATWRRKWAVRLNGTISVDVRPNRRRQWEEIERAFQAGEPASVELYKRMHFLNKRQRFVLRRLGLLEEVELARSRFATRRR